MISSGAIAYSSHRHIQFIASKYLVERGSAKFRKAQTLRLEQTYFFDSVCKFLVSFSSSSNLLSASI